LRHAIRIVFDLQTAQHGVATTVQQNFAIALALSLINAVRPNTSQDIAPGGFYEDVQDVEVILLLHAGEVQGTRYIREKFADFIAKVQIRVWVSPETLESVSASEDGNLRSVAEIVREAAINALQPDLLILPDLFCGLDDRCVASLGTLNDIVPTVVFLPGDAELDALINRSKDGYARHWILSKLSQLKRAHYWFQINTITGQASHLVAALPPNKVTQLSISDPQHLQQAAALIKKLAQDSIHIQEGAVLPPRKRKTLAYVSPMPPLKTGIASYSAELLSELDKYFDIDLILLQDNFISEWVDANSRVRSVDWFLKHANEYERVLYHFGNSPFHAHMWELLEQFSGVVVLHDIFLGDAVYFRSEFGYAPRSEFGAQLCSEYGYLALKDYIHTQDVSLIFKRYPLSFKLVQSALGVIVHSHHAKAMASSHFGVEATESFAVIPHLRVLPAKGDKNAARKLLGYAENEIVVCSFGHVVETKLYLELLDAWFESSLASDPLCHLVLVGECHGEYAQSLNTKIAGSTLSARIKITNWVDDARYKAYLSVADISVQLRCDSRGESSGSVLDCLAYGIPTVCNGHGSLVELSAESVTRISDEFSTAELAEALDQLRQSTAKRCELSITGLAYVQQAHAPWHCAERYAVAIENFYAYPQQIRSDAVRCLAPFVKGPQDLLAITRSLTVSLPARRMHKQLFVDVTAFAKLDLQTGIQRVTRNILRCLFENPPIGFRIEPVYTAHGSNGYFYARQFTQRFLGFQSDILVDGQVEIHTDDVFLGLDLCLSDVYEQTPWLLDAHDKGAKIYFVVYDLLPVTHPHWFPASEPPIFRDWLSTITRFDGAIFISNSTAVAFEKWVRVNQIRTLNNFSTEVIHIGADFSDSLKNDLVSSDEKAALDLVKSHQSFLMVGTIEPRKGYDQVLDAFDILWGQGEKVVLVIVGKAGWETSGLLARLRQHKQLNKKLVWLNDIDDQLLESLYKASSCLLAAAEGEGFGLPLIEAAHYGLPILARDIPVFREVAQDFAHYFTADTGSDLMASINEWRNLEQVKQHPSSHDMPYSSWAECGTKYVNFISTQLVRVI
jgi:glycosyltransferase involved in cell wall biosynthesis